jgi:hypothetical protein
VQQGLFTPCVKYLGIKRHQNDTHKNAHKTTSWWPISQAYPQLQQLVESFQELETKQRISV